MDIPIEFCPNSEKGDFGTPGTVGTATIEMPYPLPALFPFLISHTLLSQSRVTRCRALASGARHLIHKNGAESYDRPACYSCDNKLFFVCQNCRF